MVTILFACAICSLFVALGVNSPNRQSIDQINAAQTVSGPCHSNHAVLLYELTAWAGVTQRIDLACLFKITVVYILWRRCCLWAAAGLYVQRSQQVSACRRLHFCICSNW